MPIDPAELAADFLEAVNDAPTEIHWVEGDQDFDAIVAPIMDQASLAWGGEKAGLHSFCIAAKSEFSSGVPGQNQHFVIEAVTYRIHSIQSSPIAPQYVFELHQEE